MSKIDDGGPAFPNLKWNVVDGTIEGTSDSGMSLRQWYAGQATDEDVQWAKSQIGWKYTRIQHRFYFADAMIAAGKERAASSETTADE